MSPRRRSHGWALAMLSLSVAALLPWGPSAARAAEAKPATSGAAAKLTTAPAWAELVGQVRATTRRCLETANREDCGKATEANETLQAATSRGRAPDCGVRSAMLTVDLAFYELSASAERRRSAQRNLEELSRDCL